MAVEMRNARSPLNQPLAFLACPSAGETPMPPLDALRTPAALGSPPPCVRPASPRQPFSPRYLPGDRGAGLRDARPGAHGLSLHARRHRQPLDRAGAWLALRRQAVRRRRRRRCRTCGARSARSRARCTSASRTGARCTARASCPVRCRCSRSPCETPKASPAHVGLGEVGKPRLEMFAFAVPRRGEEDRRRRCVAARDRACRKRLRCRRGVAQGRAGRDAADAGGGARIRRARSVLVRRIDRCRRAPSQGADAALQGRPRRWWPRRTTPASARSHSSVACRRTARRWRTSPRCRPCTAATRTRCRKSDSACCIAHTIFTRR